MSVYVDDGRYPVGRMLMCHMLADTPEELLAMADRIGVSRRWLQHEGRPDEHFDIAAGKRKSALRAGALDITSREAVELIQRKRATPDAEGWFHMQGAPLDCTWVMGKLADGRVVRMHWADGGGEDQPRFRGWFVQAGSESHPYFSQVEPTRWKPEAAPGV
jgi:hypothetical protein